MKTVLLVLQAAIVADVAPTSQDLHAKYGRTDVERFRVRPDLDATVQYGSDGCLCQVLLATPISVTAVQNLNLTTYVSSDEMQAVTNEYAPPEVRGSQLNAGGFQASCAVASTSDYEHVLIERSGTACPTTAGKTDSQTRILFKRKECPVVPSVTSPAPAQHP